ncbi:MAG: hypothetical protein J0H45_11585, partial [Stenotrophomonas nitritireducens]|nr:hypothetical protein [Stenotrophomonas nitritireducens]
MGDIVGKGKIAGVMVVAALAMWLLLAGPERVLGLDGGNVGILLLMGAMWAAVHGVGRATREELEGAGSPGEWKAWLGLGFMSLAVVYGLAKAPLFLHMARWNDPDAGAVARNLVMLLVAWTVLSRLLDSRWKGAVRGDERDRGIEQAAAAWGRGALVAGGKTTVGQAFRRRQPAGGHADGELPGRVCGYGAPVLARPARGRGMKRAQDSGQVMEEERVNGREMFAAMSRQEKTAWLLLAAFGLSAGLVGWRLFFSDAALEKNVVYPAWYLFWVGYFFFIRKDRTVAADERDRIIQAHGVRAGYTALALMLVVVSVLA